MKLLSAFKEQCKALGKLRTVWLTSFTVNIEFIETYLLPAVLDEEQPKTRMDYEALQLALNASQIDLRVFCDKRFMDIDSNKRTALPLHGLSPAKWQNRFSKDSLFHPKVMYLEDEDGTMVVGTGSANLTLSGWGRNQEVFSFQRIETQAQYDAVRHFFAEVTANAGVSSGLPQRQDLPRDEGSWAFVHSFQDLPFIQQLFAAAQAKDLLVWSPYLSHDVAAFIRRMRKAVAVPDLTIHLVPDRIQGQFIRAPWTEELQEVCDSGALHLYEAPLPRPDNIELCHAKVWKLGSRLAIGSWNFTTRGANLPDGTGAWDKSVNIEAGIFVTDASPWHSAAGKPIAASATAFASPALLEEESLDVPDLPPFDIQVQFDWRTQRYHFSGQWHDGDPQAGHTLLVPGHEGAIPLVWQPQDKHLAVPDLTIRDASPLLHERRFQVVRQGKLVHRSLITETGLDYRRAQAFGSLHELLDAYVFDGAAEPGDDVPLRLPPDQDADPLAEEFLDAPRVEMTAQGGSISYFRLFQATQHVGERLRACRATSELNSWVFIRPGCLLELVEKTKARIAAEPPTPFNWFLAQEIRTLCAEAVKQRDSLGTDEDALPRSRWDELQFTLPPLPPGVHHDYLEIIQKECGYAGE